MRTLVSIAFLIPCLAVAQSAPTQAKSMLTEEPAQIQLDQKRLKGEWHYRADVAPRAWVFLQHGFQRSARNLDSLAHALAETGLLVGTFNIDSGSLRNADMVDKVAKVLEENPPRPAGTTLPAKLLLLGHSLGGNFAARLGAHMHARGSTVLGGMVLLDPVEVESHLAQSLRALREQIPVMTILEEPGACNGSGSARKALAAAELPFSGIHLVGGSHCDAEGESTDWICNMVCGSSKKKNVEHLREFATAWAAGIADGIPAEGYAPGGARFEELVTSGDIRGL